MTPVQARDGVLAISITVMLLEMKVPHGTQLSDLLPPWNPWPGFAIYIGIALWWCAPDKRVEKVIR